MVILNRETTEWERKMTKTMVVIDQMSDLRGLEFVEILVDWKTMTVWVNGPNGCLLRAVACKNILVEAKKYDTKA